MITRANIPSRQKTPDEIEAQRRMADALMGFSAPRSYGEGYAALGRGIGGMIANRKADAGEQAGQAGATSMYDNIVNSLMTGAPFGGSSGMSGGAPVSPVERGPRDPISDRVASAHTPDADYIRQGLVQRGLPPHVAEAFVHNFQDESGLNPGINEHSPLVPGSRGGFGLYQLTGPRRREYEAFAAERGVRPDDTDAQLDFLMHELGGSEARAAQSILGAPDTATAAQAIVNNFLRPSPEHRQRRAARYAGLSSPESAPSQEALASMAVGESMPMPQQQPPMPQEMAQAPMQGQQPVQMAQAGGPSMQELMEAASNPWLNEGQRAVINQLLQQQLQQMQSQQQLQQRMGAAQAAGINPMYAGDDEIWKAGVGQHFQDPTTDIQEYEYARQQGFPGSFQDFQIAKRQAGGVNVNVGGETGPRLGSLSSDYGYVLDPATGQPVIDPNTGLPTAAPVPGSPAARGIEEGEQAAMARARSAADYARTVTQDIGIADDYLSQLGPFSGADGVVGANLREARASIAGTPEYNMKQFVDSALSNVVLDTMNRMREASPAGATGFGNMSERQMQVIRGVLGQWTPGLPIEDQRYILHRLGNFYLDVQVGSKDEREKAVRDGHMTPEENDAIEAMYYPATRDDRGRRLEQNGDQGGAPEGIDPSDWEFLTPEERRLFQ